MSNWFPKKVVLVPVDFSPQAFEAVEVGRSLVSDPSHLHVLFVEAQNAPVAMEGAWIPEVDQEQVQRSLNELRNRVRERGVDRASAAVRVGSPAPVICDYAKEIGAELIVIPSHGRTGLAHLLIGSVAERVARHAPCPVLILRRHD